MQTDLVKQGYILRTDWDDVIQRDFEIWYRFGDNPKISHYANYFTRNQRNAAGFVHGGVIATFLDHCMGSMCWRLSAGGQGWTITLNTQFIKPVRVNRWAFAEITHLSGTGSNLLFDAKLYQDRLDGTLVAQAQGSFTVPGKKAKKAID